MSASAWASWETDELFRHNFDRRYGRITGHRHELQEKLALRVGLEPSNFFHQRMILSGFFEKIQIGQDCPPVAEYVEHAVFGIPRHRLAVRTLRARVALAEVQRYRVPARSYGNRIGEVAPAFGLIELWIVGAGRSLLTAANLSAFEINVATPPVAIVGIIGHVAGDNACRTDPPLNSWQNLDRGKHSAAALSGREAEVQLAVRGWGDVGEDLHLGGAVAARIGQRVEVTQQRLAIGQHGHDAAAFATSS